MTKPTRPHARPTRRVWVFSQLNHDLQPEQIAKVLVHAGLEQARREAEAEAEANSDKESPDAP